MTSQEHRLPRRHNNRWPTMVILVVAILTLAIWAPAPAQAYWYGPPQDLSATDLGGGRTQFSWNPPNPANYKGVAPTEYWVTIRAGYTSYYCNDSRYNSRVSSTSCVVTGLPYGVPITLEVRPWNPYYGDEAVAQFTLCCEVPAAPSMVTAVAQDSQATVSWTPPSNVGNAGTTFSYTVEIRPGGAVCSTQETTCSVGGLKNGTPYRFYVSATNNSGTGPAASSSPVIPIGTPGSPTSVQAFLERGRALVTWQGPADTGGAVIDQYIAVSDPDGYTCTSFGDLQCKVSGLSNGTKYRFTVVAINAAGQSQASSPSKSSLLLAVPSPPKKVKAKKKGRSAIVTWKAPKSTGGTAIKNYLVSSSPGGKKCTESKKKLSCTFSGLKDGNTYKFTVQARNKRGLGAPATSNSIYIPIPPKQEQDLS